MTKLDSMQLKVDLDKQHQKKFLEVKTKHGFQTNTEVVRHLIRTTYELELYDKFHIIELHQNQVKKIQSIISRIDIQHKYDVYNVQDFVKKSVDNFLKLIEKDMKNVLHWDIRSKLNNEEKEIVNALEDCIRKNLSGGVKASEIANLLKKRNRIKIEETLDKFVDLLLLNSVLENNDKIYFIE
jgi:hypothetical protein